MATKVELYRPYLTGKEVLMLTSMLTKELESNPNDLEAKALWRKLRKFQFNISEGIISPAMQRNLSIEESVGLIKNPNEKPANEFRQRLDSLAAKMLAEGLQALSKEEIEEGKKLELLEYGMEMGMFSQ